MDLPCGRVAHRGFSHRTDVLQIRGAIPGGARCSGDELANKDLVGAFTSRPGDHRGSSAELCIVFHELLAVLLQPSRRARNSSEQQFHMFHK